MTFVLHTSRCTDLASPRCNATRYLRYLVRWFTIYLESLLALGLKERMIILGLDDDGT